MRPTREQYIAEMMALFEKHGQMTIKQIASVLNCKQGRIEARVRTMREMKLIRVCSHNYRANNGLPEIVLGIGSEKDARPKEKTDYLESQKRYREKIKSEHPDKYRAKLLRYQERQKERLNDPVYREQFLAKRRVYERKRYGYKEKAIKPEVALDRLAMQFGITWRFKQSAENAA